MNMNKFRKILRKRLVFAIIAFVFLWVGCAVFFLNPALYEMSDFARSITPGIAVGLSFSLISFFVRTVLALKDDTKLQQMFIKENDERIKHIIYKTSRFTTIGMLILLYIGLIVSGFFNMTVFWTLYVVIFALIGLMIIGKIYFNKTS